MFFFFFYYTFSLQKLVLRTVTNRPTSVLHSSQSKFKNDIETINTDDILSVFLKKEKSEA